MVERRSGSAAASSPDLVADRAFFNDPPPGGRGSSLRRPKRLLIGTPPFPPSATDKILSPKRGRWGEGRSRSRGKSCWLAPNG